MSNWIFLLCLVAGSIATARATINNVHMFQLNSYKSKTHLSWIKKNIVKTWSQIFMLFFSLPVLLINHFVFYFVLSSVFIILWFVDKPKKVAKKPLVFTSRVKRMIITIAVFYIGVALFSFTIEPPYQYIAILIFYVLTPIVPIAANAINAPIEVAIRRYYINDAKKIISSCPNLIIIGITGSYGKTSVKYCLTTLLREKYNVLMTPESYNTTMGIVKTIREQLRSTHEVFVCEMGAKKKGEIKEICDIISPTHGIITSIGEQHLETFKTVEAILETKFELIHATKGMAFLNGDNALIRANLPDRLFQTYGCKSINDFFAYDIKVSSDGTTFSVNCRGEILANLKIELIGEHNIINVVGSIAVCKYLGVSSDEIRNQLKRILPPPHRLQLIRKNTVTIIDDAYNSNPSGCEAALKALDLFDSCKILISPGMIELGPKQNEYNYNFGVNAARVCDYIFLVGKKQTKPIFKGIISTNYDPSKVFVVGTLEEAISMAYHIEVRDSKTILFENDLPDNY